MQNKVPEQERWGDMGKAPIGATWNDMNKGGVVNPGSISRLVAREIKMEKNQGLIADSPPLDAKGRLMSLATTQGLGVGACDPHVADFTDATRMQMGYSRSKMVDSSHASQCRVCSILRARSSRW